MNKLKTLKVLYVEDDPHVRESALKFFDAVFNNIYVAHSGEMAISMMDEISGLDILISDVNMPGINGIETAIKIKETYSDIKIFFLTAYQNNDLIEDIKNNLEGSHILSKPIRLNKLIELIKNTLGDN
jgi:CheY-like chemotaxis protein